MSEEELDPEVEAMSIGELLKRMRPIAALVAGLMVLAFYEGFRS